MVEAPVSEKIATTPAPGAPEPDVSELAIGELETESGTEQEAPATAPAEPTAKAEPAPASLISPQVVALQQAFAQQQAQLQQREVELQGIRQQQELGQYQETLRGLGYSEEQVAAGTRQLQDVQAERAQLAQERLNVQRSLGSAQYEMQAKLATATHFHKAHGVPLEELLQANTPQDMEVMSLKHQLAKQKQAATPAQTFANNAPATGPATGRAALVAKAANGGPMTSAEWAIVNNRD